MKRLLIISGLLFSLVNLAGHGALSASYFPFSGERNIIWHSHSDGDGIRYFYHHGFTEHGSLCVRGQLLGRTKVIHYGRTDSATTCLHATISPIPNQERGSSPIFLSYFHSGDDIWHLGISSGGIPS